MFYKKGVPNTYSITRVYALFYIKESFVFKNQAQFKGQYVYTYM